MHATYAAALTAAGAKRSQIPPWTDPADAFATATDEPGRAGDRAAQILAFTAATGGES